MEGKSLRQKLEREGQLPVEEAVRIAGHVADALDHAHRQDVIHRDIKPGNILLQDGQALVADFGIALAADRFQSAQEFARALTGVDPIPPSLQPPAPSASAGPELAWKAFRGRVAAAAAVLLPFGLAIGSILTLVGG